MKTENADLMRMARESLKGKWGLAIGAFVTWMVVAMALQAIPKVGAFFTLIVSGPLVLGLAIFTLSIARGEEAKWEQIFQGFNRCIVALTAYLLTTLFIFLWALLLVIPGIIAGLSYSMTYYILADDESISAMDAMRKSKEMMNGNKWKLFCLGFRFFGWGLLCIPTLGVGFLWLAPYMYLSVAQFYEDIKFGPNGNSAELI